MDVRAENRGRQHQKVRFPCGPGGGEKLFDPQASGRKGQECPREIRTKKIMFMLFFFPDNCNGALAANISVQAIIHPVNPYPLN